MLLATWKHTIAHCVMFEGASPGLLWKSIMPLSFHAFYTIHPVCFVTRFLDWGELKNFCFQKPELSHPPHNKHLLLRFVFVDMWFHVAEAGPELLIPLPVSHKYGITGVYHHNTYCKFASSFESILRKTVKPSQPEVLAQVPESLLLVAWWSPKVLFLTLGILFLQTI